MKVRMRFYNQWIEETRTPIRNGLLSLTILNHSSALEPPKNKLRRTKRKSGSASYAKRNTNRIRHCIRIPSRNTQARRSPPRASRAAAITPQSKNSKASSMKTTPGKSNWKELSSELRKVPVSISSRFCPKNFKSKVTSLETSRRLSIFRRSSTRVSN